MSKEKIVELLKQGNSIAVAELLNSGSITSLDLWNNNIGDEGAKALAGVLEKNNSLTKLSLKSNEIGAEGAKALAGGLEKNNSLTSLDLYHNNIGAEGAKGLAGGLEKNNSLTLLDLGANNIGDEGAKALYMRLKKNKALKKISEFIKSDDSLQLNAESVDNYIDTHYFKLIGVCKDDRPIKKLPSDINTLIFHFAQFEPSGHIDLTGDAALHIDDSL